MNDVNNLHLVCRNLHQIANLHVNPKISFEKDSPRKLKSLVQSFRVFKELDFLDGNDQHLLRREKFGMIKEYIRFAGIHVKKLIMSIVWSHKKGNLFIHLRYFDKRTYLLAR